MFPSNLIFSELRKCFQRTFIHFYLSRRFFLSIGKISIEFVTRSVPEEFNIFEIKKVFLENFRPVLSFAKILPFDSSKSIPHDVSEKYNLFFDSQDVPIFLKNFYPFPSFAKILPFDSSQFITSSVTDEYNSLEG